MHDTTPRHQSTDNSVGPPPFGRSWATLYAVVLATLAALVVLFYLFTRSFG
jgi:hypothetical protein